MKETKSGTKQITASWKKIDEAISAIEKGKMERCQEKLAEGKKIILK